MVVGIVIGSGVFFKTEKIIAITNGNLSLGILAWLLGGLIMLICAYAFSILASHHENVNGLVDYAEVATGKSYAYYVGWFMCLWFSQIEIASHFMNKSLLFHKSVLNIRS